MIDERTIREALHDMVVWSSQLDADRVVWGDQPAPRKGGPYIDMLITAINQIGHPFYTEEPNPDSTGNDGLDQIVKSRTAREMILSVRCFAGTREQDEGPLFIINRLVARADLPTARAMTHVAGIGMAAWANIVSFSGPLGQTVFEPRAQTELRSFLASEVADFGTFIESAEVENQMDGTSFVVPPEGES